MIQIINTMGSATRSFLRNAGKLGTTKATEKRRSRNPEEIWIAYLATTVDRKATMLGTVNAPLKSSFKVCGGIQEDESGHFFQQSTWWIIPKIIGKC